MKVAGGLTQEQMKNIFQYYDRDGSGYLSSNELRHFLSSINVDPNTVSSQLSRYDADRNGQLTYPEFVELLKQFGNNGQLGNPFSSNILPPVIPQAPIAPGAIPLVRRSLSPVIQSQIPVVAQPRQVMLQPVQQQPVYVQQAQPVYVQPQPVQQVMVQPAPQPVYVQQPVQQVMVQPAAQQMIVSRPSLTHQVPVVASQVQVPVARASRVSVSAMPVAHNPVGYSTFF